LRGNGAITAGADARGSVALPGISEDAARVELAVLNTGLERWYSPQKERRTADRCRIDAATNVEIGCPGVIRIVTTHGVFMSESKTETEKEEQPAPAKKKTDTHLKFLRTNTESKDLDFAKVYENSWGSRSSGPRNIAVDSWEGNNITPSLQVMGGRKSE